MGKIKEHLDSYMHVYDNGTTARLYATPWDRNTVADGYWQTVNTIQPLINRDVYLADAIEELSAKSNRYEAGSGISFSALPDGTTQINASFAFGLIGSNGIAVTENTISLSGGTIDASFRLQNLSAKNLSAGETNLQTVISVNHSAQNLTATNSNITNITATTITSTNISTTNLTATNASAKNFSGTNISANKFSANSAQFNDISAKNFSANKFDAVSGVFANLTATNMSATNLSSTNLTSKNATITGISASTISAYDISSTNISAQYISATNLSARRLSGYSAQIDNKMTAKLLTVDSTIPNSFKVSSDFAVFSAAEATQHSLSATLTMLNNNNTNYGATVFEFGTYETRYKNNWTSYNSWFSADVQNATDNWGGWTTNYSNGTMDGQLPFPGSVRALHLNAMNIEISDLIENNVTDFILRKGNLFTYNSDHTGIGAGVSIDVKKLKPYQKYRFSVYNLGPCNLYADYIGIRFYNKSVKWIYFYNVPKTPLNYIETAKYSDTYGGENATPEQISKRGMPVYSNKHDSFDWINPVMRDFFTEQFGLTKQFMANSDYQILMGFSASPSDHVGVSVDVPLLATSMWIPYKDEYEQMTTVQSDIFNLYFSREKSNGTDYQTDRDLITSSYNSSVAYNGGLWKVGENNNGLHAVWSGGDMQVYKNTITIYGNRGGGANYNYPVKGKIEYFMNGTIEFTCAYDDENAYIYILNSDYNN